MAHPYHMYVIGGLYPKSIYHVPFLNFDGCTIRTILKKVVPDNLCLHRVVFNIINNECDKKPTLYTES